MVKVLALAVALATVSATPALAAEPLLAPGETLLEVQATGEALTTPDTARMSIGVVSTGTTAREATDANAATMAAVIAAIRKSGVDARFIRTEQINVQPRFARSGANDYEGQAQIAGYVARNSMGVTLVRLSIAPEVIASAFGAGANSANGPSLQLKDNTAALASARRDAIAKARAEAEVYADGLGMKIMRVLRVSEREAAALSDIYVSASRISYASEPAQHGAVPLSLGTIRQNVTIWIDYALVSK